jgi:hypothetical protein
MGRDLGRYSRRQFLQLTGVLVLNTTAQMPWSYHLAQELYQGRALEAARVYVAKSQAAPLVKILWPDSITTLA